MDAFERWQPRLLALCDELRARTHAALCAAEAEGRLGELARPHGEGVGDVTFALDLPSEEHIARWSEEVARREPLSVLTEDSGWRHLGPDGKGGARALDGFDHGGPRLVFDPIDGTRNLMADLRSAWTVVGFAPAGPAAPRMRDCTGGIVSELPGTLAGQFRRLVSDGRRTWLERCDLGTQRPTRPAQELRVDADARADHGYFPFFRYQPEQRPAIARLEAAFAARLVAHEGAEARSLYDDQYISSAGQLVLLALGRYRMVIDARELVRRRFGLPGPTSKPYDLAGALVCARAAGVRVRALEGGELDFPLDATTPVGFAAFVNEATRARLEPHWLAVLAAP
jgi:fructose-1,6-bisphosphatase/inositol monophosphatase family enzyme